MEKTKILIIEDDETTSFLMKDFLETRGFSIDTVWNITDGLSVLNVKKFDLLLLDLNLPDFNGFDLLSKINKNMGANTYLLI